MFTEAEVKSLNVQFHKWHKSKPAKPSVDPLDYLDQDPGITVEQMYEVNKNPELKDDVLPRRAERQHRLDKRLRECGVLPKPQFFDEEVDA